MEIKIQLDSNLIVEEVIGTYVSEENSNIIIGEIISYDEITGIAICELYEKGNEKVIITSDELEE
jgi:hypothetical protein